MNVRNEIRGLVKKSKINHIQDEYRYGFEYPIYNTLHKYDNFFLKKKDMGMTMYIK